MQISQTSEKKNRKKNVPTKYKSYNILLSFYPTAPEPSEINFPAQTYIRNRPHVFLSNPGAPLQKIWLWMVRSNFIIRLSVSRISVQSGLRLTTYQLRKKK